MKGSSWLGAACLVLGLAVVSGFAVAQDKKGKDDKKEVKKEEGKKEEKQEKQEKQSSSATLSWKAFEKDQKPFFQTLKTETTQKMTVQNMDVEQKQDQTFYFKWTPLGKTDGKYKVEQEIIGVKMTINIGSNKIHVDTTDENQPKNPMTEFFKQLEGSKFTLTIDPDKMQVTSVDGTKEMVEKLTRVNKSMEPLLKLILTDEAVKQMATPVLGFLPPRGEIPKDGNWTRETTLDLGPIGSYVGENKYSIKDGGKEKDKIKIHVEPELTYKAPSESATKESKLPFKILEANLGSKKSDGTIIFNQDKGRIESAEFNVTLAGTLKVEVAGSPTEVTLNQMQTTNLTTAEESPIKGKTK